MIPGAYFCLLQVIIVDTSGRHKQEEALFDEMKEIQEAVQPDNTTLIMDATQGQAVYDQAQAFHGEPSQPAEQEEKRVRFCRFFVLLLLLL